MRGARWRPGTVSAWIGNDSGMWLSSSSGTSVPCRNGARDHEIRQSRDAEPGHRHIEQQVGIVAGECAGDGEPVDAFMGVEGPLRPRRSRQRQAIMLQQIGGHARRSMFFQIERTGADNACGFGDLARHKGGVTERAGADGHVDLLGDQIDLPVRNMKLDGDIGITAKKNRKCRTEDLLGDGCSDADPEVTARQPACRRYLGFRGLDRRQDVPAPGDKNFAFRGQGQPARGPRQQAARPAGPRCGSPAWTKRKASRRDRRPRRQSCRARSRAQRHSFRRRRHWNS